MLKYVTTTNPSYKLKRLTHISVEFYVPSWFWIKSHPHCVDGPKNLLKMIEFSRKLKPVEQKIAQKSIQRNGFWAAAPKGTMSCRTQGTFVCAFLRPPPSLGSSEASNPASEASNPASQVSNPASQASNPASRVSNPASQASNPNSQGQLSQASD